jgi:hypothetical protein
MKKIILVLLLIINISLVACQSDVTTTNEATLPGTTTSTTTLEETTTEELTTTETTTVTTTQVDPVAELINSLDNPYNIALFVTEDLTTSIGINFELPTDITAYIEYGILGTDFTQNVEANKKQITFDYEVIYLYEVTLSGLEPGVEYEYRITTEDSSVTSEFHSFKTMSEVDSNTFMYLADTQGRSEIAYQAYAYAIYNLTNMPEIDYNLVMTPGDNIDFEDDRKQWEWFFDYSSLFSYNIPLATTTGNHEMPNITDEKMSNLEFDGYMNLPNNGPVYNIFDELTGDKRPTNFDDGKTYSFNYGDAHITVINTEIVCGSTTSCSLQDTENLEIFKQWLSEDLQNSDRIWNIVMLHRGPYTMSYDTEKVRTELVPIFEANGVDLVLSGHDHKYSRAVYKDGALIPFARSNEYMYGTVSLIPEDINDNYFNEYSSSLGVTYLTSNTSGIKFYDDTISSGTELNFELEDDCPVIPFVTVSEDSITVTSYILTNNFQFNLLPEKIEVLEEFTILP